MNTRSAASKILSATLGLLLLGSAGQAQTALTSPPLFSTPTATPSAVVLPTVTIVSPTAHLVVSNAAFDITGKTHDTAPVTNVVYSFNGSEWMSAESSNHWASWYAPVTLAQGTNVILAEAFDTNGNVSTVVTGKVVYVAVAKLLVETNDPGWGTIHPNYNGKLLRVGDTYTITATAAPGFAFYFWGNGNLSGDSASRGGGPTANVKGGQGGTPIVLTNGPTLEFTMTNGVTLVADFEDIQPPTVTITSPTPGLRVSNTVYTVKGAAKDNVAVGNIFYQLNGGGWQLASTAEGGKTWFTPSLTLAGGSNVFQVYAVDTSENISHTNSVVFFNRQPNWASNTLAGLVAKYKRDDGVPELSAAFGATNFSLESTATNINAAVGTYVYTPLTLTSAQLVFNLTAPAEAVRSVTNLVTFTTAGSGVYTNTSTGASGEIDFAHAKNLAPASLDQTAALLITTRGKLTALTFGAGTLTLSNFSLGLETAGYEYQDYSPVGALLTSGIGGLGTNELVMSYLATNSGDFFLSTFDTSNDFVSAESGVFVFPSASPAAPSALKGLEARQLNEDGSVTKLTFGATTFTLESSSTNEANDVGTYTYGQVDASNALVTLTVQGPPSQANSGGSVWLHFVADNFCIFTNTAGDGSNELVGVSIASVTNVAPTVLAGHTVDATNAEDVVSTITYGNGTFTQAARAHGEAVTSTGTYTYTPYSPVGGMLVMKYKTPVSAAGSVSYIQPTFASPKTGAFIETDYDKDGNSLVTDGVFSLK